MSLYMIVTADRLELPLGVYKNFFEMSQKTGRSVAGLRSTFYKKCRANIFGQACYIVSVHVEMSKNEAIW